MTKIYLAFLIFLCGILALPEASLAYTCHDSMELVDGCTSVYGWVSHASEVPTTRIRVAKTHELLSVRDDLLPPEVERLITGPDIEVYGNFIVCPFTKPEPDKIQSVCVASYTSE